MNRKQFLKMSSIGMATAWMPGFLAACTSESNAKDKLFFDISLAEWSLHRSLFKGELDHLDFPGEAKHTFGINAVEYVNQFFKDKAKDTDYLDEMSTRCSDLGVEQVLIMIDEEGELAVSDDQDRQESVENHYKWVEAAEYLGCHSIRVNARGDGTPAEQKKAAIDGLGSLATFAKDYNINIIVENHGGYSSNGEWLAEVMQGVNMQNCGTLPDFGNFCMEQKDDVCLEKYDRYKGVRQMMPFAKGVSAKSYTFNNQGKETEIDYLKMLQIVHDTGYTGHIGIEYEGDGLSEIEGIKETKKLLFEVGKQISAKDLESLG